MPEAAHRVQCDLCPRLCRVDRDAGELGFCRAPARAKVSQASLHHWEEPCLSGTRGSGTIFFTECNLRCVFCQNAEISQGHLGREVDQAGLVAMMLDLQARGAHNINLVSPTPYIPQIREALVETRARGLSVPVVYNTNAYETVEALRSLEGLIQIYLPDLKYPGDAEGEAMARRYSKAPRYFETATAAIQEMVGQVGPLVLDDEGIARSGVIIRHLVIPGHVEATKRVLNWIRANLPGVPVSLMSQYTPYHRAAEHPEINRRLTRREYHAALDHLFAIGLEEGWTQELSAADEAFIPDWDLDSVPPASGPGTADPTSAGRRFCDSRARAKGSSEGWSHMGFTENGVVTMKYGRGTVEVPLPAGEVLATLRVGETPPLADPAGAIRKALRTPIGSPPLAEVVQPGEIVCVLLNDPTRLANTDFFLPILLDELNRAGVRDGDIFGVFATGSHRPLTEAEMKAIAGRGAGRIQLYNHDSRDEVGLAYAGRTSRGNEVYINRRVLEADRVILTGSVVYHFFAGFGGGRKALVPGVAGFQTIQANHGMMLEPGAEIGRLAGNPVHEDLVEAARLGSPDFLLNVVLDDARRFLGVFAGDFVAAHEAACGLVRQVYGVPLKAQADLVVAGAGGHPKDINVYQVQKAMDNAALAVRPGGVVVLLAECPEGHGNETYHRWMTTHRTPERIEAAIRERFELGGHKAYAVTRLMRRARFVLCSGMPPTLARELLFTPAANPREAVELALEMLGTRTPSIVVMPDAGLTVPVLRVDASLL